MSVFHVYFTLFRLNSMFNVLSLLIIFVNINIYVCYVMYNCNCTCMYVCSSICFCFCLFMYVLVHYILYSHIFMLFWLILISMIFVLFFFFFIFCPFVGIVVCKMLIEFWVEKNQFFLLLFKFLAAQFFLCQINYTVQYIHFHTNSSKLKPQCFCLCDLKR